MAGVGAVPRRAGSCVGPPAGVEPAVAEPTVADSEVVDPEVVNAGVVDAGVDVALPTAGTQFDVTCFFLRRGGFTAAGFLSEGVCFEVAAGVADMGGAGVGLWAGDALP